MNAMRYAFTSGTRLAGGLRPTLGRDITAQRGHTPASNPSKYDWRGRTLITQPSNPHTQKALALIKETQRNSPFKAFMMQYSNQQPSFVAEKMAFTTK